MHGPLVRSIQELVILNGKEGGSRGSLDELWGGWIVLVFGVYMVPSVACSVRLFVIVSLRGHDHP